MPGRSRWVKYLTRIAREYDVSAGARAVVASGDGSPEGVRSVIHRLHKLQYAEQATWSQAIAIPESGILITPEQGEVFSLLRRDRFLD
ncbi:hypothetical protein [Leptolyngbya iicbica]|uniref:hypothetical protein n=1 Tax=Leptolyngbya iicbica TaxID=3161580 RepID=UPI001F2E5C4D|nr:hypothetical protein [Leptolyngbya sp. LK]